MTVIEIEHEGIRATIDYRQESYVATLVWTRNNHVMAMRSFGNGIRAEDWILEELKMPSSLLYLKYS